MTKTVKVTSELGTFTRRTAHNYQFIVVSSGTSESYLLAQRAGESKHNVKMLEAYRPARDLALQTGRNVAIVDGNSYSEQSYMRANNLKRGALVVINPDAPIPGIYGASAAEWQGYIDGVNQHEAEKSEGLEAVLQASRDAQSAGQYRVEGWTSRIDLANKLADATAKHSRLNIHIIEISTGKVIR